MTLSSQQTLWTFRHILREFTKPCKNLLYKNELKQAYADYRTVTDPAVIKGFHKDAEDLLSFLAGGRKHKELLELYNPGQVDQHKRVELSAKRVGLQLPQEFNQAEGSARLEAATDEAESPFLFAAKQRVKRAFETLEAVDKKESN